MQTYPGDGKVSVIEGSVLKMDEHIVVAQLWNLRLLVEFEAIEAAFTGHGPLFGGRRCHI